jgi:hypothetical protein
MEKRTFTGATVSTTLASNIGGADSSIVVANSSTFPLPTSQKPSVIVVGRGTLNEEKILVNDNTDNTFTVQQRGYDGTMATTHTVGEIVDHVLDATFLQDVSDELSAVVDGSNSQTIRQETGTTYTVTPSDAGKMILANNSSAITITIPGAGLSDGQRVDFIQMGNGQVTFNASNATINGTPGLKLRGRYSAASVVAITFNQFLLIGDLSA